MQPAVAASHYSCIDKRRLLRSPIIATTCNGPRDWVDQEIGRPGRWGDGPFFRKAFPVQAICEDYANLPVTSTLLISLYCSLRHDQFLGVVY